MEIYLVKTLSGSLKPAYNSDYDNLKKVAVNEPLMFTYKKMRNAKFHRKFIALIKMVFDNQERYTNFEDLRKDLTIAAGYYTTRFNLWGVEVQEAKSISFANMDEIEFNDLYSNALDAIIKNFHFDKADILENVEQFF